MGRIGDRLSGEEVGEDNIKGRKKGGYRALRMIEKAIGKRHFVFTSNTCIIIHLSIYLNIHK